MGKYDLFIWLAMTVLKVLFKPIILINQYDGRSDSECWKDGIKIEFIIVSNGTHISVGRPISTILKGSI